MSEQSTVRAAETPAERAIPESSRWNDAKRQYSGQRCVPALISAQAAANPRALGIAQGSNRLTYGDLEARANQLAHHLLSLGLKQETPVGLCLGHSIDFVVARSRFSRLAGLISRSTRHIRWTGFS